MKHTFIAVKKQNIESAMSHFENPGIKPYKYCLLDDKLVLREKDDKLVLCELFNNIEVFHQNFSNKSNMLDYWGKTIIPPHTVSEIKHRIESNSHFKFKMITSKEFRKFVNLIDYAIKNEYYIVHLGI